MVADASEDAFGPYYTQIMPLLLNVLVVNGSGANGAGHGQQGGANGGQAWVTNRGLGWMENTAGRRLRCKAMECCGLIAIAVGKEVFRADSGRMVELLTDIQREFFIPLYPRRYLIE